MHRVHEILQRMVDNPRHIESLKTCCGVLAILSRDEANKLLIARDGIRLICAVMDQVGVGGSGFGRSTLQGPL